MSLNNYEVLKKRQSEELKAMEARALAAEASVAACLQFLETELEWEGFRTEMWGKSASERNAEKLTAFLKGKGHLTATLADYRREVLEEVAQSIGNKYGNQILERRQAAAEIRAMGVVK